MFFDYLALNQIILKETTLKQAVDSGKVKIAGSQAKLDEMLSYLESISGVDTMQNREIY